MFDIISIGDTTVDVFMKIDEASVLCTVDRERCQICLQYGSKIPVQRMMSVNGAGNAANCAVSFARLGWKTALYTIVGADDRGRDIVKHLKGEKVGTAYIVIDKKRGTNYSSVIEYQGDRTILAYHEERQYRLPRFSPPSWLYFSSIAGNHEEFNHGLAQYVKKNKVKLAFNPGTRQMALGITGLRSVLEATEVLFVNLEEAKRLVHGEKSAPHLPRKTGEVKHLLVALHNTGPREVVITDGDKGSYGFDGNTAWYLPIFEAPVVQHTGCGDAYSSAYVAARMSGQSCSEAMRSGTFNAASVIGQMGSQAGLLSAASLHRQLKKFSTFQPRVLLP